MWISKEDMMKYENALDTNSYYLDECRNYVHENTELRKENAKLKENIDLREKK